jgi:RNA polymerase sigma factor (sigma-70 family)
VTPEEPIVTTVVAAPTEPLATWPVAAPRRSPETARDLPTHDLMARLDACDPSAWDDVVAQYGGVVRANARAVLRDHTDVDDACQRTWVALMTHALRITDPARLAGWLATTARREALSIARSRGREMPTERPDDVAAPDDPTLPVLAAEMVVALHRALRQLPPTQRALMTAMLDDDATYDRVSAVLGMPRGSIGPTRARALATLRRSLAAYAA